MLSDKTKATFLVFLKLNAFWIPGERCAHKVYNKMYIKICGLSSNKPKIFYHRFLIDGALKMGC